MNEEDLEDNLFYNMIEFIYATYAVISCASL